MQRINFSQFKIKNPDYRGAFEELCYHLFCRKFNISDGVHANFNETGLETQPIKFEGKHYGFQAKFFDQTASKSQIEHSLTQAFKHFKNLDTVIVYLNRAPSGRARWPRELEEFAETHEVTIEWVVPTQFVSLLSQPKNLDLAQLYFGIGDEFGFIKNNSSPTKRTFVQSSVCLSLPFLKDLKSVNIEQDILKGKKNASLVLGNPGSGKTIFMHRLFYLLSGHDKNSIKNMESIIKKNKGIPMLINLKECSQQPLETIIRNRQNDYNLRFNDVGFIYLFDGLDELSQSQAENTLLYISTLATGKETRKIIVSCRSGNHNRYLFNQYVDAEEYEIDDLTTSHLDEFFKVRAEAGKTKKLNALKKNNGKLINSVTDIFLVQLLWETINEVDNDSSFIDLFKEKIDLQLNSPEHKKDIEELNVLDPKQNAIVELNQDISFEFQKKFQYRFKRSDLQKMILQKFPKLDYKEVNKILNFLCSQFFAPDNSKVNNGDTFIYQHRRYQEFFLAQRLKKEYEKNRKILRQNFLANYDFFEPIFLPYLRKEYEREKNLPRLMELNLINVYLGNHSAFGADDPYFSNASNFIDSLALQDNPTFQQLLADENLSIREKLGISLHTVVTLWSSNKKEEALRILTEFEKEIEEAHKKAKKGDKELLERVNETIWSSWQSWMFVRLVIDKEGATKVFEKSIRGNYKSFSSTDFPSYQESGKEKLLNSFLRVCLNNKVKGWNKVIKILDDSELLSLMKVCIENDNIENFLKQPTLQKTFKKYLTKNTRAINKDDYFLLFIKSIINLPLTDSEKGFGKEYLKEARDERQVDWRMHGVAEKYALVSFALNINTFTEINKEQNKTLKHKEKRGYSLPTYYDELRLYAALFNVYVKTLKSKRKSISQAVRSFVTYGEANEKFRGLYLKFETSRIWSRIFSHAGDSKTQLYALKSLLLREDSNVSSLSFALNLRKYDPELFNRLVNEQEVDDFTHLLENWDRDLPEYVEMCFDLAILFSTINPDKAVTYISQGINDGILRHGWRKDSIVSYHLVEALELLWERNWLTKKQLSYYTSRLMSLTIKVASMTDGKGTWQGPYNAIELAGKFDTQLAEKLKKELIEKVGYHNVSNIATTHILMAKVRQGIPLDPLEKEMNEFRREYDYDSKPRADYYEQKMRVYLEITQNDLYTPAEKKKAFLEAYKQIEEMQKNEISYYLSDAYFEKERALFKELCKKYKRKNILPKEKSSHSSYKPPKAKSEKNILVEIRSLKSKRQLKAFYKKLSDYHKGMTISSKETWDMLLDKTYQINGNIEPLLSLLKESGFPHSDFYTSNSKYFHFALAAGLHNPVTRDETMHYLYRHSGYQGFSNTMRALQVNNERKLSLRLFRSYFDFCDFLVN